MISSRIVRQQGRDTPAGQPYAIFRPEITYRYSHPDGQSLEATALVSQWSKDVAKAEQFLRKYPIGSQARISSDPDNPGQVRFDVAMHTFTLWQPIMVLSGAALCLLVAWRTRRRIVSP